MHNSSYNSLHNYNSLPRQSALSVSAMNSSFGSTASGIASPSSGKPPPARGFGATNYVLKDEYERDRTRWQQKLDEAEERLSQSVAANAEMARLKAQLNKKIIDIEKNQRPMMDCNRRLAERNKTLGETCRNLEETLSFVRDENLTLKDQYDRLVKENASLKEQRAFPEKLEELERYRAQVLEYSKCITSLRQSLLDKDRRHDLLVQKLRKIKKAIAARRDDDDRQSCIGSEGSADGSIALDTITEDFDDDATLVMSGEQPTLSEQLDAANGTILELRAICGIDSVSFPQIPQNSRQNDKTASLLSRVQRIRDEQQQSAESLYRLELELANARDTNDLLEFQLVELNNAKQCPTERSDQSCSTEEFLEELSENGAEPDIVSFDENSIPQTKSSLRRLAALFALNAAQRTIIRDSTACISGLEHVGFFISVHFLQKLLFTRNQLNMSENEMERRSKLHSAALADLQQRLNVAVDSQSQKKKELKATVERLKAESGRTEAEALTLRQQRDNAEERVGALEDRLSTATVERESFKQQLEMQRNAATELRAELEAAQRLAADAAERRGQLDELRTQCRSLEDQLAAAECRRGVAESDLAAQRIAEIRQRAEMAELERIVGQLRVDAAKRSPNPNQRSMTADLADMKAQLELAQTFKAQLERAAERDQREIAQLRKYNEHLEAQFNSQMEMIAELKKRFIDLSLKNKSNSTESISWSSSKGSSSLDDEQYHSEEAPSEENFDTSHSQPIANPKTKTPKTQRT